MECLWSRYQGSSRGLSAGARSHPFGGWACFSLSRMVPAPQVASGVRSQAAARGNSGINRTPIGGFEFMKENRRREFMPHLIWIAYDVAVLGYLTWVVLRFAKDYRGMKGAVE